MSTTRELFPKAAEQGKAEAQYNLGLIYINGQGIKQNYKKAKEWFTKAAEQDLANAQYNLAVMYYNGNGGRSNLSLAKKWIGKACENGHKEACKKYKILDRLGIK